MAEIQPENSQSQPNPASASGDIDIGGNVGGNFTDGNNNVINNTINNYYQKDVEKNTEKHEPDYWALKHPYPMPPNFTGRIAERALLTYWLKEDSENRLFILRALGGFGKSALTWHWLTHDVDIKEYPKVVFWSFYEGDASFEHFIEETLKYLKIEVPHGGRPQVDELLKAMQAQKILFIMDGFERVLRLYSNMNAAYQNEDEQKIDDRQLDCKDINAEWFLRGVCSIPIITSKVLLTTRLTPGAVKQRGEFLLGCREEELKTMQKDDAVEFFRKQKINGIHAEIEHVCAAYGYHPLSLRILAGLIINDREKPGDIAVADNLDITNDIIQNKNHVLKVSYNSLSFAQQKLLSNMACFRSLISYEALKIITSKPSWKRKNKLDLNEKLDKSLQILESRGLVSWHRHTNNYDLHPIVRRYAYERLSMSDRSLAHRRLRDYFATLHVPAKPQSLEEVTSVIELYHHTLTAGHLKEACDLIYKRLYRLLYFQFGAYETCIELLKALILDSEEHISSLDETDRGWVFNELAGAYALNGQPQLAISLVDQTINIAEMANDKKRLISVLVNKASMLQIPTGNLRAADSNLRKSIEICKGIESDYHNGLTLIEMGHLSAYCGMWRNAEDEFALGIKTFIENKEIQVQSIVWGYRAQCALLLARDTQEPINEANPIIEYAQRALDSTKEYAKKYHIERDFVTGHWLMGAAYLFVNQVDHADRYLGEALKRCRAINNVEHESNILLDLARLRYNQKNYEEAKSLADEALLITERCGYVLQGADVNLFLAQYALEQENDKAKAKEYAETALKLAYCDGPPYYYKVAYHEAERFLENLK